MSVIFNFLSSCQTFSKVATQFYIPDSSVSGMTLVHKGFL